MEAASFTILGTIFDPTLTILPPPFATLSKVKVPALKVPPTTGLIAFPTKGKPKPKIVPSAPYINLFLRSAAALSLPLNFDVSSNGKNNVPIASGEPPNFSAKASVAAKLPVLLATFVIPLVAMNFDLPVIGFFIFIPDPTLPIPNL